MYLKRKQLNEYHKTSIKTRKQNHKVFKKVYVSEHPNIEDLMCAGISSGPEKKIINCSMLTYTQETILEMFFTKIPSFSTENLRIPQP